MTRSIALRDKAAALGLTLRFDLPVPYSEYNPVVYEAEDAAIPEGAGKAWLYVEPDGDVLPSQGNSESLWATFCGMSGRRYIRKC